MLESIVPSIFGYLLYLTLCGMVLTFSSTFLLLSWWCFYKLRYGIVDQVYLDYWASLPNVNRQVIKSFSVQGGDDEMGAPQLGRSRLYTNLSFHLFFLLFYVAAIRQDFIFTTALWEFLLLNFFLFLPIPIHVFIFVKSRNLLRYADKVKKGS